MDFVADGLAYGRRFRCLNIVDEYTRECLAIQVETSLPGLRVTQVLQRLAETLGLRWSITVDSGPGFVATLRRPIVLGSCANLTASPRAQVQIGEHIGQARHRACGPDGAQVEAG